MRKLHQSRRKNKSTTWYQRSKSKKQDTTSPKHAGDFLQKGFCNNNLQEKKAAQILQTIRKECQKDATQDRTLHRLAALKEKVEIVNFEES